MNQDNPPRAARDNSSSVASHALVPHTERTSNRLGETRYRCPACGEFLLYRETRCTACDEESPVYNLPMFWRWLYAGLLFGGAFIAYQIVT